uniref:SKI family transcriptional corepressor 2 n=1 Tax=Chrysemys picta bellii TaxID=8478 RepID=A0A8C3IQ35_CHRPI
MATSPRPGPTDILLSSPSNTYQPDSMSQQRASHASMKPNQVGQVILYGIPIVSLVIDGQERLCLAQISNTLLKNFSYNEIHNRRVALGITCVQCTPVQLEILRRAGAMPISSRRCGMITKREAERLCKSFLGENRPPKLPDNFAFDVSHECAWGCRGSFIPARYNSSRAKCIKCSYCSMYFSPNKFIFHSHRTPEAKYTQPDAANFNSWRRHLKLTDKTPQDELVFAWEDVKAMFNGGSRKRALPSAPSQSGAAAAAQCHPLGSVKAAAAVVGGGLLSPHLLGAPPPELQQKRARFEEDEELEGGGKSQRSYPVIPVPSKGSFGGVLHKLPGCGGLFPHPYGFPAAAFSLCHKKEEGAAGEAHKAAGGLSGLFWPGRKEAAFYPPFCMFWPPRAPRRPAGAHLPAAAAAAAGGGGRVPARHPHLLEGQAGRKAGSGYHHSSAFRPVGGKEDSESLAKLHGASSGPHHPASPLLLLQEEPGCERHPPPPQPPHRLLSPGGTSCSYPSEESSEEEEEEDEEEEQEVDVEGHKQPEEEEQEGDPGVDALGGSSRYLQSRGLTEKGGGSRDRAAATGLFPINSSRQQQEEKLGDTNAELHPPPPGPPKGGNSSSSSSPVHHPSLEEQPSYKDVNIPFRLLQNKEHNFFITEEPSGGDFWRDIAGEHTQETNSPHSLKKDVENMGKEELQKVLFEQIDLRRRLEQEFQVLKGNASFPVFNNFQDQMKRELAYREEMVQQLQIVSCISTIKARI